MDFGCTGGFGGGRGLRYFIFDDWGHPGGYPYIGRPFSDIDQVGHDHFFSPADGLNCYNHLDHPGRLGACHSHNHCNRPRPRPNPGGWNGGAGLAGYPTAHPGPR